MILEQFRDHYFGILHWGNQVRIIGGTRLGVRGTAAPGLHNTILYRNSKIGFPGGRGFPHFPGGRGQTAGPQIGPIGMSLSSAWCIRTIPFRTKNKCLCRNIIGGPAVCPRPPGKSGNPRPLGNPTCFEISRTFGFVGLKTNGNFQDFLGDQRPVSTKQKEKPKTLFFPKQCLQYGVLAFSRAGKPRTMLA